MAFEPVSLNSRMMSLPPTSRQHGTGAQTANTILGILDKFKNKTPSEDGAQSKDLSAGRSYSSISDASPGMGSKLDAPAPAQVSSSPYDESPTFNLGEPSRAFEAPALESRFGFADVPKRDHGAFGRQLAGAIFSGLV